MNFNSENKCSISYNKDLPYKERIKDVARLCYDIADAMLEARSK